MIPGITWGNVRIAPIFRPKPTLSFAATPPLCWGKTVAIILNQTFNNYAWSTGITNPALQVTPSVSTTYRVTVTDANGCKAADSVRIVVSLPTIVPRNDSICSSDSLLINGKYYSQNKPKGQDTLRHGGIGCDTILNIDLRFFQKPTFGFVAPTSVCAGKMFGLSLNQPFNNYVWSTGSTAASLQVTPLVSTTYSVMVTDSKGCKAQNSVRIIVDPTPTVAYNPQLCPTDSIRINGNFYSKRRPIGQELFKTAQGCDSLVNISLSFVSSAKAVDDVFEISEKDSLVTFDVTANDFMNATSRKQVTILQRPLHGILKELNTTGKMSFQSTSILRGSSQTFTYRLCNLDCPTLCDSARVTVHIKGFPPNIKPSKGITANADGINDKLEFEELDDPYKTHPNNELIVYNRWNDIVFTAKPYKNDWDGTNRKGEPLPAGTYYYILRLNIADGDVLSGDVTIIR